jgi:hypothetical protein
MEMPINSFVKPGVRPLYVDTRGYLWAGRANELLVSKDHGMTFQVVARYQKDVIDRIAGLCRISFRLFRAGLHAVLPLRDGGILGITRKRILRCEPGTSKLIPAFRITRGTRPLSVCQIPTGEIFFGEYFSNSNREAVHIFGSQDGGKTWSVIYTFPPGSIRHVHSIIYDEYRIGCWIFTGDSDEECRILFTDDSFNTLETIISGNQRARTVSAIPIQRGLIIPTDTPFESNVIQLFDPERLSFEEICKLPGSAFFTGQAGDYLLVSTVVEPSQVNPVTHAALFVSSDDGRTWSELYRHKKDRLPGKLFQYGALALPAGKSPDAIIYAYGQALEKIDGHMLRWKL